MGRLSATPQGQEEVIMPLSRDFKQTIRARAERDPEFRLAMLQSALSALDVGEAFDAKVLLRDFINATVGFTALGEATGRNPKSLMRMFSPAGNPSLDMLSDVLRELARREGYTIRVEQPNSQSTRGSAPRSRKAKAAA
jgi:DNA-binding phage protein